MITYKDMAWCETSLAGTCGNINCSRNYTDVEDELNKRTVDLPVSIQPMKSKECGHEPV